MAADSVLEKHHELQERAKRFALRILKVFRSLPNGKDAQVIGAQLLRSGTSVAANYRAAGRSRSRAEFVSKMAVVIIEEADESVFWLEFLAAAGIVSQAKLAPLIAEGNELVAIFSASRRTQNPNKF
jgi:four helix bundle protein